MARHLIVYQDSGVRFSLAPPLLGSSVNSRTSACGAEGVRAELTSLTIMSCKKHRVPKKKPYGSKRGVYWCHGCDAALVPDAPSKKRERQVAKQAIAKEKKRL